MILLGIDPGPTSCGVCGYDSRGRAAFWPNAAVPFDGVLGYLRVEGQRRGLDLVAIERVQSTGQSGASLLETSEVVGRLQQRALDSGLRVVLLYRREVLHELDVTGRGCRDAVVRQRLLEMHGGSGAQGTKKAPGALYGVAGHGWQALAVAVAAAQREGREGAR